ncbi:MAG: hypothetical protein J2P18_21615 [Nocardia sp.]|nr:hypothetical protein [Nocardia sp.]
MRKRVLSAILIAFGLFLTTFSAARHETTGIAAGLLISVLVATSLLPDSRTREQRS